MIYGWLNHFEYIKDFKVILIFRRRKNFNPHAVNELKTLKTKQDKPDWNDKASLHNEKIIN